MRYVSGPRGESNILFSSLFKSMYICIIKSRVLQKDCLFLHLPADSAEWSIAHEVRRILCPGLAREYELDATLLLNGSSYRNNLTARCYNAEIR